MISAFVQQGQPFPIGFNADTESQQNHFGQTEISVPATLSGNAVAAWLTNMHAEYCSVVESGRVIGRLTKAQLLAAISRGFGQLPIGQILMQRQS